MTLTELANELKKFVKVDYLTVSHKMILLWVGRKPYYRPDGQWWTSNFVGTTFSAKVDKKYLINYLDLSEYEDKKGNIDYSKCIIEIKDEDSSAHT